MTLADALRACGLEPSSIVAIRNTLHLDDVSEDFRDIDAVIEAGVLGMYDRMQDSAVIDDGSRVLSFVALPDGFAKLTGFRVFRLRSAGNVPGDIVYNYDAAHLLHAFIARAKTPVFYDAFDLDGLDDWIGALVVAWPGTANICGADDAGLVVANGTNSPRVVPDK